jgi:hypothetical protein
MIRSKYEFLKILFYLPSFFSNNFYNLKVSKGFVVSFILSYNLLGRSKIMASDSDDKSATLSLCLLLFEDRQEHINS